MEDINREKMLYDIGFLIFSVFYLPILIFKGKLHASFAQRFGLYDKMLERALLSGKDRIWIQAVSVGEVALCKELIPLLKDRFAGRDIVISTITKAGNDLARKMFPNKEAIVIYFPLDFSFVVGRVIDIIKPSLYVMIETEIWPNLLKELARRSVPSILINGRISDASIGRYRMAKPFLKDTLRSIRSYCMQDTIDAERIVELGAPGENVRVTGNMKFDIAASPVMRSPDTIRAALGITAKDELIVAGSTHKGEEEIVAQAFRNLSREFAHLKLLIAPRHVNRVTEIERAIEKLGLTCVKVSAMNERRLGAEASTKAGILILDTIGHLNDAYSVAMIVFIGGSLVNHGGHNPIEPAIFEKPIIFGPHMFNFKYITNAFLKNRAAIQISDPEDLFEKLHHLLKNGHERTALGLNARRVVAQNRGATNKNLDAISAILR